MSLREIAPGVTVDEVRATTGCNLIIPSELTPVRQVA
jgi:acyl CoA:acetate/3-ketoacid CoA transferase beta subunit